MKPEWTFTKTYPELLLHMRMKPYDGSKAECYVVDFEVFHMIEWHERGNEGELKFQRKDSTFSPDPVDTADEAETIIKGSVRFDGCSNVNFGDNGYIHACGREDLTRLGTIMDHVYNEADSIMTWTC